MLPPWRPLTGLAAARYADAAQHQPGRWVAGGAGQRGCAGGWLARCRHASAGVLFAIAAVGDLVGGLVLRPAVAVPSLALRLTAAQACGGGDRACCLALTVHDLAALMAAMFLAGLGGSARGITMSALLDHVGHADAGD